MAVGTDKAHAADDNALVMPTTPPARRACQRRRELNKLKGGMKSFDSVPWVEELALGNAEFDVAWRLTFGGVTARMAQRINHPSDGFAWREGRWSAASRWP